MIVFTLLVAVFIDLSIAEITKRKIAKPQTDISMPSEQYDGMKNFLGTEVKKYIGQTLYLLKDGIDPQFCKKTPCDMLSKVKKQDYQKLENKYFEVLDVSEKKDKYSISSDKYYLKLKEKETGELWYFVYSSKYDFLFPFVVIKYFDTQKSHLINKKFILKKHPLSEEGKLNDINTGKSLTINPSIIWTAIDVSIIEDTLFAINLILRNDDGVEITFPTTLMEEKYIIEENKAKEYRNRFGEAYWKSILNNKIRIGMTDEMCRLSWGEPKEINKTITKNIIEEQWVYGSNFLYFTNGKLTAIQ
jgi:hypothetical protein